MRTTPDQFMATLNLPEVYRVGGSVRDELLGRRSHDSDYMVRLASLSEIRDELVAKGGKPTVLKTRDGRQVGWRAAVRGLGLLEVVLPRTERSTGPGHGDFEIVSDPALTLAQDCTRRDFTINALYRDVKGGEVLDPTGIGINDLAMRLIRTTNPNSFRDDPLRTLRALRFVSKLNFVLERTTLYQMKTHADAVTGLSLKGYPSGTILTELSGLLMGQLPGNALRLMRDSGVMAVLLPELAPMLGYEQRSRYHSKTTDEHTFDAVQAAANMREEASLRVRWALLLHDSGKPAVAWRGSDGFDHYYAMPPNEFWRRWENGEEAQPESLCSHEEISGQIAGRLLRRLNAPNALRNDVFTLVRRHMVPIHQNIKPFKVRQWRAELGDELLHDLIVHRTCDVIGKLGPDAAVAHLRSRDAAFETLEWIANEQARAKQAGVPLSAKDLAISGHDIMAAGFEGREIGRVQADLLHEVLAQPKLNDREWLLKRLEKMNAAN